MRDAPALVLSDWAIGFENFSTEPFTIITELLLHSLLYERLYLQEENIVTSVKLARAFMSIPRQDALRLLAQLLSTGALRILTLSHWPPDLADLSQQRPVYARALYVQRYGARPGAHAFTPTVEQSAFYDLFDEVLSHRRDCVSTARSPSDVIPLFHATTNEVLGNPIYKSWIAATAGGIPRRIKDDFISYIDDPGKGVERLASVQKLPRVVGTQDQQPVFMRGLGFQLASLYERRYARAIERLLQSTFNAAFCHSQQASGRFGKGLAEVVIATAQSYDHDLESGVVRIERTFETSIPLPSYFDDLGAVFSAVRELPCVATLRTVVHDPKSTDTATVQAWESVAEELARRVSPTSSTQSMVTALVAFGKEFVKGTFSKIVAAEIVGTPANYHQIGWEVTLAAAFQGVYQGGPLALSMLRRGFREDRLLKELLCSFHTRCSEVEVVDPTRLNAKKIEIKSFSRSHDP